MRTPDKGIPRDLLERANCVIIIPGMKKGAFGFGGKYGRGFAVCRARTGWGAPAGVRIEGGSFGLQIGGVCQECFVLGAKTKSTKPLRGRKWTVARATGV